MVGRRGIRKRDVAHRDSAANGGRPETALGERVDDGAPLDRLVHRRGHLACLHDGCAALRNKDKVHHSDLHCEDG
eukprot:scaffold274353_cov30-Tisochrysis_lutea.AAC.4